MPSIRDLSSELKINPNTVQRAYQENDAILFFKDFYSDFDEVKTYELLS